MKFNKIKKERGVSLIVVLTLLFFLSLIGLGSYYIGNADNKISYNVILNNKLFNSAENAINYNISSWNLGSEELNSILKMKNNENQYSCLTSSGIIYSQCSNNNFYSDGSLKSYSVTKLLNSECLSYGNTDQSVYCYEVEGFGELGVYPFNKTSNVQEIKIKVININNNGVYEF